MASVNPFRALMFDFAKAGRPEDICCPPYDIIPDAGVWREKSPFNVIRLEKPEGDDPYGDAAGLLKDWKERGILRTFPNPAYYLYEIGFTDAGTRKTVSGIFAHVQLNGYGMGEVLPHENTLAKAKADRYALMMATKCHFSPIYCMYRDDRHTVLTVTGRYKAENPAIEFTDADGMTQRLWIVDDPEDCEVISKSFAGRSLYIADGHHRFETSLKVRRELGEGASPNGFMLLVDMDHPGLVVHPTHRIVTGIKGYSEEETLTRLAGEFEIAKGDAPAPYSVVYITPKETYLLKYKDKSFDGLDVSLLHDHILQPLFGIDAANMAEGKNLLYTRDANEAFSAVRGGGAQCAFLISPTRVGQIREAADSGEKMPQKSTYFYPKLITGLVMNEFGA
ncbi:MAG: DUF1015 domain-containing protein [Oscillospiraceae bacterium]|jgi:uncharacterized protein (DUF1015 family)|nr:DUF1015 domain-containing protein [Oscillospiraceae bacterium]